MSPRPSPRPHPFRSRRFPQRQYYLDNWNRYYYPSEYGVPIYIDDSDDDIIVIETPAQESPQFKSTETPSSTLNILITIALIIVGLLVLLGLILALK
jgi:hypothetical protein